MKVNFFIVITTMLISFQCYNAPKTEASKSKSTKLELIEKVLKFSTLGPKVIANHKHPFFGEMTNEEWDLLQWKHLNHHLNQFSV